MLVRKTFSKYLVLIALSLIIYIGLIAVSSDGEDDYINVKFSSLQNSVRTNRNKKINLINSYNSTTENFEPIFRKIDHLITVSKDVEDASSIELEGKVESYWLQITRSLYVYSAYWDARGGLTDSPFVRTIGIFRFNDSLMFREHNFRWTGIVKKDALDISCFLWYENDSLPLKGVLDAFVYEEALNEFVGAFLNCRPFGTTNDNSTSFSRHDRYSSLNSKNHIPYAVSFVPNSVIDYPHKLIYLHSRKKVERNKSSEVSYGACVRSFYGPYDDHKSLILFVLYYNVILDVKTFYFYELALSLKLRKIIRQLRNHGINIHLLNWNLPTGTWDELWDLGSLALLNDCLYRTINHHDYTIFVDIDEFIVPRLKHHKISDIYLSTLEQKKGHPGDAVLVPNGFFCSDFKKKNHPVKNESLPIFRYVTREARLWPPKERSKIIVQPESVVAMGHHMVHKFVNMTQKNIGSLKTISALHHYRVCGDLRHGIHANGAKVVDGEIIKDTSMIKFKNKYINSKKFKIFKHMLD